MEELSLGEALSIIEPLVNHYRAMEKLRQVIELAFLSEQLVRENQQRVRDLQARASEIDASNKRAIASLSDDLNEKRGLLEAEYQGVIDSAKLEIEALRVTIGEMNEEKQATVASLILTRGQCERERNLLMSGMDVIREEHGKLSEKYEELRAQFLSVKDEMSRIVESIGA